MIRARRACLALFGLAAITLALPAAAQTVNMRIGMATGPDTPQNIAVERFVEIMRERSNGAIAGKVFHSGSLGGTNELLESMVLGTVQGTVTVALDTYVPATGVLLLPYLFRDQAHFYKVVDSPIGDEIVKAAPAKGLRVLSIWDSGFRQIWTTKKPINSLADLKGMKIRVPPGRIWVDTFKAFDVNPTPLAYGEVYTSLQQGVLDGMEQPIPNFYFNKFLDVAKFMFKSDYMAGPAFLAVSERWWRSLTPAQQKIAQEAADEAKTLERRLNQEAEEANLKDMEKNGLKVSAPDLAPFRKAAESVWPLYGDRFGKDLIDRIANFR